MSLFDGLEAFWKLEEASGTRADHTANDHDLVDVNSNIIGATGKVGNGANFSGTAEQALRESNPGNLNTQGSVSISCWFQLQNGSVTQHQCLASMWGSSGTNAYMLDIFNSDGVFNVRGQVHLADTTEVSLTHTTTLSVNVWHHAVMTYDATSGDLKLYLDNGTAQTQTSTGGNLANSDTSFLLGNNNFSLQLDALDGLLDATGVWTRALSASDVSELWNNGDGFEPGFGAVGSGGMVFGGTATPVFNLNYIPAGGLNFGGQANALPIIPGEGGLIFGGQADTLLHILGEGGMAFNGSANALSSWWSYQGGGGLVFAGTASPGISHIASGGMTFSGQADVVFDEWGFQGSGGLNFGGSANTLLHIPGEGGMAFSGEADVELVLDQDGQGGSVFSGTAPVIVDRTVIPGPAIFDNQFRYRKRLTIPAGKVASTLTNHPVLVRVTLDDYQLSYKWEGDGEAKFSNSANVVSSAWTIGSSGNLRLSGNNRQITIAHGNDVKNQHAFSVAPEGTLSLAGVAQTFFGNARGDIVFEEACSHTPLAYDIESYNATNGELTAWVKMATIPEGGTEAYVYYSNFWSDPDPAGVWSNGYEGVWHMSDYSDGAGLLPLTQRINTNIGGEELGELVFGWVWTSGKQSILDGTSEEPTEGGLNSDHRPTWVPGKILDARRFDGNDHLDTVNDSINNADDITIEAWVKPNQTIFSRQAIFNRGRTDLENGFGWTMVLGYTADGKPWAAVQTVSGDWKQVEVIGATTIAPHVWTHLTAVWKSGKSLTVYVNGEQDGQTTTVNRQLVPYQGGNQIGLRDSALFLKADLDEVRLSRVARSDDWIKATHDIAHDPNFVIVGIREQALHLLGCPPFTIHRNAYTPEGGLVFSGSAQSDEAGFSAVGDGGVVFGGIAPLSRFFTSSGGLTLSDTAAASAGGFNAKGSGGLGFGSTAPFATGQRFVPTGKLRLAGQATSKHHNNYIPSGGLKFKGQATSTINRLAIVGSGGLNFGGTSQPSSLQGGTITFTGQATSTIHFSVRPVGKLRLAGSSSQEAAYTFSPSGGFKLKGTSPSSLNRFVVVGSGGLVFGGTSQLSQVEGGTIALSGQAIVKGVFTATPSGGLEFGNSATVAITKRFSPSGQLTVSGSAKIGRSHLPSGGLTFSGEEEPITRFRYSPSGGVAFAGVGTIEINFATASSGGLTFFGEAALSTYFYGATGGLAFSGEAEASTPSFNAVGSGGLVFVRGDIPVDCGGTITPSPGLGGTLLIEPVHTGTITVVSVFDGDVAI